MAGHPFSDVFTMGEVARAAGVDIRAVAALVESGEIRTLPVAGRAVYLSHDEAVRAGYALSRAAGRVPLFGTTGRAPRARAPFAISSIMHAALLAIVALATASMGAAAPATTATLANTRLVYLVSPGPGGGGGGGGAKKTTPAPVARRQGSRTVSSPLPARSLPAAVAPPVVWPEAQPIAAPIVTMPADDVDQAGVVEATAETASEGPGENEGAGAGTGGGAGDGIGDGAGEGEGGGTGGGPYRPGSGVEPPRVLREVKPHYTETARQRGLQGDVLLEIVVHRDGSVGDVRIVQGLGHGLDQRAVEAVRQWRFAPAQRLGVPVDVMVEVAMEFRLR